MKLVKVSTCLRLNLVFIFHSLQTPEQPRDLLNLETFQGFVKEFGFNPYPDTQTVAYSTVFMALIDDKISTM